jgi:general secretion pathway protein C
MIDVLSERERLNQIVWLGGWLTLLLALAACLWIASKIFWQLLPGELPVSGSAPGSATVTTFAPAPGATTDLSKLHLFGQSSALVAPVVIDAPETSLDLRLLGTLASEDPKSGLAIITDSEGLEAYYGVGDELPGRAELHEIHSEKVILVRQGRFETLSLREDDGGRINRNSRRGVAASPRDNQQRPSARSTLPGIRGNQVDPQAMQEQYRVDPAELAKKIQFSTFTENGKPVGVRLQAGRDAALMRLMNQAGLRSTDIITSVNGVPLNDPGRAFEAMSQLQNQTRFQVVVRRAGREQTLDIDLNR